MTQAPPDIQQQILAACSLINLTCVHWAPRPILPESTSHLLRHITLDIWDVHTFHNSILLKGLAATYIDQDAIGAHGVDGLCIHQVVCALCVRQGHHHIIAVSHQLVQLVGRIHLQSLVRIF